MYNRVGIQIVTNRPDYLGVLLSSLLRQSFKKFDLIIVYNKCKPIEQNHMIKCLTHRFQLEGHRVYIIKAPDSLGVGALRNVALNHDDNEFGLRIDDDSWCEPDYIERLLDVFRRTKKTGAVGGIVPFMIMDKSYSPLPETVNEVTPSFEVFDDTTNFYNVVEDFVACDHLRSSFMYRNEDARKIKGFPTCYDKYAGFREETDFCLRLKFSGLQNYFVPKAVCWHLGAPTGGTREGWNRIGMRGKWRANDLFMSKMSVDEDMYDKMQKLRK
ncbi:MAG: glycosyltransferase family 2 protein [Candidatus Heimdallarchaeota archaeon]